ncbi:MAG: hypothetical protein HN712_27950 [Gemmatimonadetes bacterium]|jgi:hypothetical protein|nr:hypothetical protein [Gemmatimonadota bacterium]MBT7864176.1 hypothetical protein [Gemmatimonadota bacterium]
MLRQILLALLVCLPAAAGHPGPQELLDLKLQTAMLTETTGTMTGEGVAWHAAWRSTEFVRYARESEERAFLEAGVIYFDALIGKLHTSPDGFKGWVGPFIYDESVIGDVHVGDAILVNPMLEWVEYVHTELAADQRPAFEATASRYLDLAQHICDKWDARGTWWESGHAGGYITWDQFLSPDDLTRFQQRGDVRTARLGLQFNKQQSMGIVHLRLYRLTGDEEHRRRAQLIFQHAKARLTLFEGHYTWNYWEPFYPGDVVSVEPPELNLWVATHPHRNYQSGEVSEFVEAFHSGLVFSAEDMQRLVRTNWRMWNGDREEPAYANSDAAVTQAAVPGYEPPLSDGHGRAGTLWRALADFDSTLSHLAERTASNTRFERRYDLPVSEFQWPQTESTYLSMISVLPPAGASGQQRYLVSKARAPGHLRILLIDADGGSELAELYAGATPGGVDGREGVLIREWDATIAAGAYRVRWVFTSPEGQSEYRDYPIAVTQD